MQFTTFFATILAATTAVSALPIPDNNPIHLRSLHQRRSGHGADIFGPFAGHAVNMARSYITNRGY